MKQRQVEGAEEMQQFAAEYVAVLVPQMHAATVIALSGGLGAGKTTFTQGLGRALGVGETVASPTFVIEKIYALSGKKWQRLVHIDAYRVQDPKELSSLGWDEIIADPTNLILIEWPERVSSLVPETAKRITIHHASGDARDLSYDS